ncbi:site-2 protease family protein [Chloroflexota bacterium]
MKGSLRLGKVLGITIGLNYTWFIIFALLTLSLATSYFPGRYLGWASQSYWGIGIVTSVLFFVSVLLHELAHSVVALAWGIPVKSITLFIFGGVASIEREPERPLAEFLIAIAGPASSLLLAGFFGILGLAGRLIGLGPLMALGVYLAVINFSLALFNMIPGFPLDGGRVFRSIVWAATGSLHRATRWAAGTGRVIAVAMIVGGGMMILTGNWTNGLWLAFIGWFLDSAASQSAQQAGVRQALEGYTAGDFVSSGCQAVDHNMPIDWVVRDYVLPQGHECFLVTDGQQAEGVATLDQIQQIPRQKWGWTPVRQIMTPLSSLKPVLSGEKAYRVLERMMVERQHLLPVIDDSRLVGLVRRENLLHFARTRSAQKA